MIYTSNDYIETSEGGWSRKDHITQYPEQRSNNVRLITKGIKLKTLAEMRDEIQMDTTSSDDLIQDLLPHSNSAYLVLAGRSGIGKTFLLLNILYCLASGTPFLNHKTKKCKVGYISFEGDRRKILKRFDTIGKSFENTQDLISWGHLMPFPLNKDGIPRLTELISGLDVVGIDCLRYLIPGDYLAPKDMSAFVQSLRTVQNNSNTVILLIHHIRKPDRRYRLRTEDLLYEIKGASEIVEAANTVLLMDKGIQKRGVYGKFAKSDPSDRVLYIAKAKDSPTDYKPINLQFDAEKMMFQIPVYAVDDIVMEEEEDF